MEARREDRERTAGEGRVGLPGRAPRPAGARDDDDRLVALVGRGDAVAFAELFGRHRGCVLSVCRRMLDPAEAEDALQQTFLAAYLAIARRGERPRHLRGWLRSIARNECLSQLRSRQVSEPFPDQVVDRSSAVDDVALQQAEVRGMVDDVRRLPSDQRAALVLSELDELPHRQIAESLDCRPRKVKALVFQARATLTGLRAAREVPCERVREQVTRARVGRPPAGITRHLQTCRACAEFARDVRRERRGAVLPFPFGAALEWVRSVFGGASAPSATAATAGGAACGGASAGTALQAGLAKLGILAIVGGAAAGAGVGGLRDGAIDSIPEPRPENPSSAGPIGGQDSDAAALGAREGSGPRPATLASGDGSPLDSAPTPRAGGEKRMHGPGTNEGASEESSPTPSARAVAAAGASGPSQASGAPATGAAPPERGLPPTAGGPDGAGPPATTPRKRPPWAGPEIPASGRPPGVEDRPLGPNECPLPAPAHIPVC